MKSRKAMNPATRHWRQQHRLAVILIPLSGWLAVSLAFWPGLSGLELRDWLASPRNAVPLVLFLVLASRHAALGLQVVLEDYVHPASRSRQAIRLVRWLLALNVLTALLSILRLTLFPA